MNIFFRILKFPDFVEKKIQTSSLDMATVIIQHTIKADQSV